MTILKLMHPRLKEIDQKQIGKGYTKASIAEAWRLRYGKKFNECTIEEVVVKPPKRATIFHIPTEEVYPTIRAAAAATGFHVDTIARHCKGFMDQEYRHRIQFKYAS